MTKTFNIAIQRILVSATIGFAVAIPASADSLWVWSYSGADVNAGGTFITGDTPDALGFYQIQRIRGFRNGEAIVRLYPAGSAIPGNEPYKLDNAIGLGPQNQITVHGFGYKTAKGSYANPYYADWTQPPGYFEVLTTPPFNGITSELPVKFFANRIACKLDLAHQLNIIDETDSVDGNRAEESNRAGLHSCD